MELGGARAALITAAVAVATLSSVAAGSAVAEGGRPCLNACFDQCVPRNEFWFCQFSCYGRCTGPTATVATGTGLGCEHSCVLSMCGQLRPGTKMMAACRDTCRKSYAAAACSRGSTYLVVSDTYSDHTSS